MTNTQIIIELARLWDRADPDTQHAMVQWTKEHEHKIDWPLFPELLAAFPQRSHSSIPFQTPRGLALSLSDALSVAILRR